MGAHTASWLVHALTDRTRSLQAGRDLEPLPDGLPGSPRFERVADAGMPHQNTVPGGGTVVLEPGHTYMINPGSVGQPRDQNSQASFAILDTDAGTVAIERIGYDIHATQQQIIEVGLPRAMAQRLLTGT